MNATLSLDINYIKNIGLNPEFGRVINNADYSYVDYYGQESITEFTVGLPEKIFNNPFIDKIDHDSRLDAYTKEFLHKLIAYERNPQKPKVNWTKERARRYFKYTKYRINKIYKQLRMAGYLYIIKKFPVEGNNRISWNYILNFIVDGSKYSFNSNKALEETKEYFKKPTKQVQQNPEDNNLEDIKHNLLLEEWKKSYFMDLLNDEDYKIDIEQSIKDYLNNALNEDKFSLEESGDLNSLADFCWNVIVKSKTYNDKAFDSFRYSKAGIEMSRYNINAIKQIFNTNRTYQPGESKINKINTEAGLNKLFLVNSTMIIHNYVKFNFLDGKLPTFKELLGLYTTIAEYPELICLKNNIEDYKLLDKLFNINQERYKKE